MNTELQTKEMFPNKRWNIQVSKPLNANLDVCESVTRQLEKKKESYIVVKNERGQLIVFRNAKLGEYHLTEPNRKQFKCQIIWSKIF